MAFFLPSTRYCLLKYPERHISFVYLHKYSNQLNEMYDPIEDQYYYVLL